MKRMGLIQQKRPLYHQLIALLCIPPMGASFVFFVFSLSHTISPFTFSRMLVRSLSLRSLHNLHSSNRACQRFLHSSFGCPLVFSHLLRCFFSFPTAQLKCRGTFQQFAAANLCLLSVGRITARGAGSVCVIALVSFNNDSRGFNDDNKPKMF